MRVPTVLLSFVLLAACGEVIQIEPDASPDPAGDAGADAPPPDLSGPIQVTVMSPAPTGGPAVGATIVVSDRNGTRTATTGSDGKATVTALPESSVTAVVTYVDDDDEPGAAITTVVGARPGDDLVLGPQRRVATDPGKMTVRFPAYNLSGGTLSHYYIFNGCTATHMSPAAAETEVSFRGCNAGTITALVVAYGTDGTLLGSISREQTFSANGTIAITGTWTTTGRMTARYSHVPYEVSKLVVRRINGAASTRYSSAVGTIEHPSPTQELLVTHPAFHNSATVVTTVSSGSDRRQIFAEALSSSPSYDMSFENMLLPWLSEPKVDLGQRSVSWTASTGAAADGGVVQLHYQSADKKWAIQWRVIAPPGVTTASQPDLPAELDALELGVGAIPTLFQGSLFDLPEHTGYDAFRPHADRESRALASIERDGTLGDRTKLRVSTCSVSLYPPAPVAAP